MGYERQERERGGSYAIAEGGLSASLRDLGRFGMIYARNGYLNGRQIVPEEWVRQTRIGDTTRFAEVYKTDWARGAYRNQFWIDDVEGSVIMARGVFGQLIYIDHERDFVGVKLSSWPVAIDPVLRINARDMMNAIAASL
ncbi:hypothetical protein C7I85_25340 [Mesorhizobium soli]|uniref:Uncharacterized protein n=1 Tax=Pseudaminobacter soli (ex Li et al. 2025) TaxID=1295366 RepID=A0A2P7S0R1_9HYPH|nr:hypothetical protein C7I85_25340 [Mesorhizobium soli]